MKLPGILIGTGEICIPYEDFQKEFENILECSYHNSYYRTGKNVLQCRENWLTG